MDRLGTSRRRNKLPRTANNYILVVFDSCRYDSFVAAHPKTMRKLGKVEQRWSYASWTAPSHYNLLMGLMPHSSPQNVFASEYYQRELLKFNQRLGLKSLEFSSFVPRLYLPSLLQELGYRTHAMVSLPVLNPATILNTGFDRYKLMERHNDMRAMLPRMTFDEDAPSFYLLNVGETHYPYALPSEPKSEWPEDSRRSRRLQASGRGDRGRQTPAFARAAVSIAGNFARCGNVKSKQCDISMRSSKSFSTWRRKILSSPSPRITANCSARSGYFGHGPIQHPKVFEVPFVEGKIR